MSSRLDGASRSTPDTVKSLMTKLIRANQQLPHARLHDLRHLHATTMQIGRIASDASFGTLREHALPAAQRAALRCHQPAGPPRGCGDLGLRRPSVCDATMMRLMPLRGVHDRCACWHRDASGSSRLHRVHHQRSRSAAPGRHRSREEGAGPPHHWPRHPPDLAPAALVVPDASRPAGRCSRGRRLARQPPGTPTGLARRGRGRHASQSPAGGRSRPGPATRLGRSAPVITNLGSSLQAPRSG